MIRLFGVTDTTFSTNGDLIIRPIEAIVHKEDNGPFYLDLTTDLSYVDALTEGRIVYCSTPQGDEPFRVHNVQLTRKRVKARCRHVFYDSENYLIADSYVVDKNANDALDHLNSATEPVSPFTTISDISLQNSYRCVRKSLYEAVQEVVGRWGGHLTRIGWQIGLRESIGADNQVTVRYAKNMQEITVDYDWSEVVTKLMPVGSDGLLLPEEYLTSSTQYSIPYTKSVSFTQSVDRDAYLDEDGDLDEAAYEQALIEDLRAQATTYLENHCVPQVTYTLTASLEKITDIGDTVEVIDEKLGINLMTNVISYDYNVVLDKYINITFGNFQKTIVGFASSISSATIEKIEKNNEAFKIILGEELNEATEKIWNAMSNSHVIYDGDRILVVDRLPKEDAHYCLLINAGGIGFSSNGINGTFNSAWTIDGTLDMQQINVINLIADMIRGGTLKLGGTGMGDGMLEVYDGYNTLIGRMDKYGFKMYGPDGSYIIMNAVVGFAGYDSGGHKVYWVDQDEFHMRKAVIEDEITLCGKMRFIPITIMSGNNVVNDGIGLVSVAEV